MSFLRIATFLFLAISLFFAGCGSEEETQDQTLTDEETTSQQDQTDDEDLFRQFAEAEEDSEEDTDDDTESGLREITDADDEEETTDTERSREETGYFPEFYTDGNYVVQVSTIASQAIAEDVARKLEDEGYPVYIAEVINPSPELLGTYYRVRIGGFRTINDAEEFGENILMPHGYSYWVDNRSNDNVGIGDYGLGQSNRNNDSSDSYDEEDYQRDTQETAPQDSGSDSDRDDTDDYESRNADSVSDDADDTQEDTASEDNDSETDNTDDNIDEVEVIEDDWDTSDW
ncbi:MAG: SPOR domain-containing protein [Fibrobacterota bacterium]